MSEQIYVALIEEGVRVWRPVQAYRIQGSIFIVERPDDYDPSVETWEFPPGSTVVCEHRQTSDGDILAAVRPAKHRQTA
ncbi:MAG: hypothetical protein ABSH20_08145 [Tepidisphaeraceae bacterium]